MRSLVRESNAAYEGDRGLKGMIEEGRALTGPAPRHGFAAAIAKVRFTYVGANATLKSSFSPTSVEETKLGMT